MNKQNVIDFFNSLAPTWDADMIRDDSKVDIIMKNTGIRQGCSVLDVACGTGVLIPDYIARGVSHITAIDISPEMIRLARPKFSDLVDSGRLEFICNDVEEYPFRTKFDSILVYNAFPHFPDGERLIARLSGLLADGGCLSIAHGMSREALNRHHSGRAADVSVGLISAEELSSIFGKYLSVTTLISDDSMYQVSGTKRS